MFRDVVHRASLDAQTLGSGAYVLKWIRECDANPAKCSKFPEDKRRKKWSYPQDESGAAVCDVDEGDLLGRVIHFLN